MSKLYVFFFFWQTLTLIEPVIQNNNTEGNKMLPLTSPWPGLLDFILFGVWLYAHCICYWWGNSIYVEATFFSLGYTLQIIIHYPYDVSIIGSTTEITTRMAVLGEGEASLVIPLWSWWSGTTQLMWVEQNSNDSGCHFLGATFC